MCKETHFLCCKEISVVQKVAASFTPAEVNYERNIVTNNNTHCERENVEDKKDRWRYVLINNPEDMF